MFVLLAVHVFHEIERLADLADVVIVGRHPRQQGIGADRFGGGLDQIADDHRMVIGAGRLDHQFAQHRRIHVRQFQQLDVGGVFKEMLHQGDGAGDEHRAKETAGQAEAELVKDLHIEGLAADEVEADDHQHVDQRQMETGAVEGRALLAVAHPVGGGDAAGEGVDADIETVAEKRPEQQRREDGEDEGHFGVEDNTRQHRPEGEGQHIVVAVRIDVGEGAFQRRGDENPELHQDKKDDEVHHQKEQVAIIRAVFANVDPGEAVGGEKKDHDRQEETDPGNQGIGVAAELVDSPQLLDLLLGDPFPLANDHLPLLDLEEYRFDLLASHLFARLGLVLVEGQVGTDQFHRQCLDQPPLGAGQIEGAKRLAHAVLGVAHAEHLLRLFHHLFLAGVKIPHDNAVLSLPLEELQVADDTPLQGGDDRFADRPQVEGLRRFPGGQLIHEGLQGIQIFRRQLDFEEVLQIVDQSGRHLCVDKRLLDQFQTLRQFIGGRLPGTGIVVVKGLHRSFRLDPLVFRKDQIGDQKIAGRFDIPGGDIPRGVIIGDEAPLGDDNQGQEERQNHQHQVTLAALFPPERSLDDLRLATGAIGFAVVFTHVGELLDKGPRLSPAAGRWRS